MNLLGCDISASLMPPDRFNEKGYWESPSITDLNDQILASAGLSWEDWQPFRADWFSSPKSLEFQARAVSLLEEQFGQSHLFVIKDPRLCRTLPVWIKAMEYCGVQPMVVSPIRAPSEVAKSLAQRNGMNGAIAQLLWLQYTLDAEFHSRQLACSYLNYETILSDWRVAAKRMSANLGLIWPRQSSSTEIEIDAFLNPSLRHHKAQERDPSIAPDFSSWVNRVFQLLSGLAEGGDQAESRAELDVIRTEFENAAANFARPLLEHQSHGRWLASRLEAIEAEARSALTDVAALALQRDALTAKVEEQHLRLAEVQAEKSALEVHKVSLDTAQAAERQRAAEELADAQRELDEIRERASRSERVLEQYSKEIGSFREIIASKDFRIEQANAEALAQRVRADAQEAERLKLAALAEVQAAEVAAGAKRMVELQSALEERRRAALEHEARAKRHEKAYEEALAELNSVRREIDARNTELANYDRDVLEASESADRLKAELEEARSMRDRLTAELDRTLAESRAAADTASNLVAQREATIEVLSSEAALLRRDLSAANSSLAEQAEALAAARRDTEDAAASASSRMASIAVYKREAAKCELLWREAARSLQLRNEEFDNAVSYIRRLEDHIASIENNSHLGALPEVVAPSTLSQIERIAGGAGNQVLPESQVVIDGRTLPELMGQIDRLSSIEGSTTGRATRSLRDWVSRHAVVRRMLHRLDAILAGAIGRNKAGANRPGD